MRQVWIVLAAVLAPIAAAYAAATSTLQITVTPASPPPGSNTVVLLDGNLNSMGQSGIFTGSQLSGCGGGHACDHTWYTGTPLIANLSNANHTSATYALSTGCGGGAATDNNKFLIDNVGGPQAQNGGWHTSSRVGPFLLSNAYQAGQRRDRTVSLFIFV